MIFGIVDGFGANEGCLNGRMAMQLWPAMVLVSVVVGDVMAGNAGSIVVEPGTCVYVTASGSGSWGKYLANVACQRDI